MKNRIYRWIRRAACERLNLCPAEELEKARRLITARPGHLAMNPEPFDVSDEAEQHRSAEAAMRCNAMAMGASIFGPHQHQLHGYNQPLPPYNPALWRSQWGHQ